MPDDIVEYSNKAKGYIYSTVASAKAHANNAGTVILKYATGVTPNDFTQSTSATVKEDYTEAGNKVKQAQVYTIETVKEGEIHADTEVKQTKVYTSETVKNILVK